jgi:hypothetical protein
MSTTRCALLILVAACSSKKQAEPAPAAPCLPGEISSTGTGIAAVDGITARACWGDRCLTLDRDGKVTGPADHATTASARRAAEDALVAMVTLIDASAVSVCDASGRCVTMPVPETWIGPSTSRVLVASASRKRLSAFLADRMETWEPKTATKITSSPLAEPVTEARYVGDSRILTRRDGSAWMLRDLLADRVLVVGKPGWNLTVVDAKTAVVFEGAQLAVVNAVAMDAGTTFTLPGRVAMATAWFDRILVVLDHPAGTAQIDPATGTIYAGPALPICK